MTVGDLIQQMRESALLTDEERNAWFARIPYMSDEQIRQFAWMFKLFDQRLKNLEDQNQKMLLMTTQMFEAMNSQYEKKYARYGMEQLEGELSAHDLKEAENSLNELNNDES